MLRQAQHDGRAGSGPSTGSGQAIRTEPMTVNIGPQHPSTHGVFRLRVTFDGEEILQVEPIFGYLHRGTEKLAEERNYTQVVTLTDRLDYVSSMINNQAYCLAVEKAAGRRSADAWQVPADAGRRVTAHCGSSYGNRVHHPGLGRPRHSPDVLLPLTRAHSRSVRDACAARE